MSNRSIIGTQLLLLLVKTQEVMKGLLKLSNNIISPLLATLNMPCVLLPRWILLLKAHCGAVEDTR
jgi:hypothetical protein